MLALTTKSHKLISLLKAEGIKDLDALIDEYGCDTVCPAICLSPDCDYTDLLEPDQTEGWCNECQEHTMVSAFILAEVI